MVAVRAQASLTGRDGDPPPSWASACLGALGEVAHPRPTAGVHLPDAAGADQEVERVADAAGRLVVGVLGIDLAAEAAVASLVSSRYPQVRVRGTQLGDSVTGADAA